MNSVSKLVVDRYVDRHRFRKDAGTRAAPGFSLPDARVAHFRLSPRRVEIPHPVAYSNLVETIAKHWTTVLEPLVNGPASQLKIRQHDDGRIASMEQTRPYMRPGVGARFRVRADITSFYESIYTHAVPWAILGRDVAKRNRGDHLPANEIDTALRFVRRGETTGVSIGPGTSLIVAEVLLSRVDQALAGFRYERFLDDYYAFTSTESEAEEFVRRLDSELRAYGLRINGRKTVIEGLPVADVPAWVRELRRSAETRPSELLDHAIDLSHADPKASSIRWALTTLRSGVERYSPQEISTLSSRLAELSFTHPYTTSGLVELLLAGEAELAATDLNHLLQKHISDAQTSAVCWLLHLAWQRDYIIDDKSWDSIASSGDHLAMAYLLALPQRTGDRRRELLLNHVACAEPDDYSRDEAWPVRYIAYLEGREELEDPSFEELRVGGVRILRDPRRDEDADDALERAELAHMSAAPDTPHEVETATPAEPDAVAASTALPAPNDAAGKETDQTAPEPDSEGAGGQQLADDHPRSGTHDPLWYEQEEPDDDEPPVEAEEPLATEEPYDEKERYHEKERYNEGESYDEEEFYDEEESHDDGESYDDEEPLDNATQHQPSENESVIEEDEAFRDEDEWIGLSFSG